MLEAPCLAENPTDPHLSFCYLIHFLRLIQLLHNRIWKVVKIMVLLWVLNNNTAPSSWGTQKGTIILTTTHMYCIATIRRFLVDAVMLDLYRLMIQILRGLVLYTSTRNQGSIVHARSCRKFTINGITVPW